MCCLLGCCSKHDSACTWAGDEEEWRDWSHVGDPIMHIELRRWADCLVIAPLSANTLAKLAQGMCDNLLTCVVRMALALLWRLWHFIIPNVPLLGRPRCHKQQMDFLVVWVCPLWQCAGMCLKFCRNLVLCR